MRFGPWVAMLVVLGSVTLVPAWAAVVAVPRLTIGIVPQLPAWILARRWAPLLQVWSQAAHVHLVFRTAPTIAAFERRVAAGRYDLVYLNPADYDRYRGRYRAFARGACLLQGVLVVRRDSGIRSLRQLAGQSLAFPARHALAASVQPRAALARQHIPFLPHYVGSHASVYLGVSEGLFTGGGGVQQTLSLAPLAVRQQLRVIWRGPQTLPHPFAARRSLAPALVQVLARALIRVGATQPGPLRPLGFTGFLPATDRDYRPRGLAVRW